MRLKNKVALITGSSRGLGAAIAERFVKEGAQVIITYFQNKVKAEKIAKENDCELILHLDVTDRESIKKAFNEAFSLYGRVDILVNNAGVNFPADFDKQTDEEWNYVIDVNLTGTFRCCQEILPFISDHGKIINIGSLSGEYGGPRTPSYACSKMGIMALTHNLARFVGQRGICVNALSPGVIESELTDQTMSNNVRETVDSLLLLKRLAHFKDITGGAVFLASNDSDYLTGQTISINGGVWVH